MMLKPGSYKYPFQFQLPPDTPSSFEGHIGRVRYYVKATMDIPWAFDDEVTSYFTVLQLLDLNTLPQVTVSFFSEVQAYVHTCKPRTPSQRVSRRSETVKHETVIVHRYNCKQSVHHDRQK